MPTTHIQWVGNHRGNHSASKVLQIGYYWPSLCKHTHELVKISPCQKQRGVSRSDELPLTHILEIELFNVWRINFIGSFVSLLGNKYISVVVDDVSRWVEAITLSNNEGTIIVQLLKWYIFARFGTPRAIIAIGGSHFLIKWFSIALSICKGKHKITTPYHLQKSGEVEVYNK